MDKTSEPPGTCVMNVQLQIFLRVPEREATKENFQLLKKKFWFIFWAGNSVVKYKKKFACVYIKFSLTH